MEVSSSDIRDEIDATRESLDAKLNLLESKARETIDVKHQVGERPWLALGAAVAVGFVAGSLGSKDESTPTPYRSTSSYSPSSTANLSQRSNQAVGSFMQQFEGEINLLKGAAVAMATDYLRDAVRDYLPAIGNQFKQAVSDGWSTGSTATSATNSTSSNAARPNMLNGSGKQPTTAPGAAMTGEAAKLGVDTDEIPPTMTRFGKGGGNEQPGTEYYDVADDPIPARAEDPERRNYGAQ